MPLLDTPHLSDAAILLIDLQHGIEEYAHTNSAKTVRLAAETTVKIARLLDMPLFVSLVPTGPKTPEAVSELSDFPAHVRQTFGAFDQPEIREAVAASARKVLAIGGIVSEVAVLQGARTAMREGYTVYILTDCCGGLTARTEAAAFSELQRAGAVLSSVVSFFTTFANDMPAEQRFAMLALARGLMAKE